MPEAADKIAAAGGDDNDPRARRALFELDGPIEDIRAAACVLALAVEGISARRETHEFAAWEGEALEYLAWHIHDLAEMAGAIRGAAERPAQRD
jgi:hypothetical protein